MRFLEKYGLKEFMSFWFALWVFVFGLSIGSFLNVLILRLQSNEHSIWTKRSYCFHCRKTIWWRDLVPVLSWFWLRRRCRSCKARISARYPLVEIFVGFLAVFGWWFAPNLSQAFDFFIFCALALVIGLIDLESWLIPVPLLILMTLFGLGFGYAEGYWIFESRLIGALLGFGFLAVFMLISTWILRLTGRLKADESAMGFGDPLLMGAIGAYLGWLWLPFVLTLGSLQAVIAYGLISWVRKPIEGDDWAPPDKSMPFGPFLTLAAIEISIFILIQ
ncbi:MAG: prepilin peptidase [Deltaproteobacteria bacterium]|nr:prepilin peptidase [Deltaproteobacteria bacterium]